MAGKRKYKKSDAFPPRTRIADRVRYLIDTGPPRGRRMRTQAGGVMERTHDVLFAGTPKFPDGIVVGGFQVYEKDNDGKDVMSTRTYDLNHGDMNLLRAYAYGRKLLTPEERAARQEEQKKIHRATKGDGAKVTDLRAEQFGRMLALAQTDPVLQKALLKAWAGVDEESVPKVAEPEEGEQVPDLTPEELAEIVD